MGSVKSWYKEIGDEPRYDLSMKSLYTLFLMQYLLYTVQVLFHHIWKKKIQDYLNHLSILISTYNLLCSEKAYNWEGEEFRDGSSCKIFREIYQIIKFEQGSWVKMRQRITLDDLKFSDIRFV